MAAPFSASLHASLASSKQALSSLKLLPVLPFSCITKLSRTYCQVQGYPVLEQQQLKHLRSPELVALEYTGLNLPHKTSEDLGHVRIRQHVNPLTSSLSSPVEVPNWSNVFRDPTLPLMVDIGSGSGRFLLWLAKTKPDSRNYLGLEIRKKLVKRSECWVKDLELDNIHFLYANASISFQDIVSAYPGPLMLVSILCPDPHFKRKHLKRRVVQRPLADSIVNSLATGGKVFMQSDVHKVAVDMREQFDEKLGVLHHMDFIDPDISCDHDGWLTKNPMGIRTEREVHAEFEGARIYRRMYQKHLLHQDYPLSWRGREFERLISI